MCEIRSVETNCSILTDERTAGRTDRQDEASSCFSQYCGRAKALVRSAHAVCVLYLFISGQTLTLAVYSIKCLFFIIEVKSVYSAVRTGYLNKAVCACATYNLN
jgi:hypothetical protein